MQKPNFAALHLAQETMGSMDQAWSRVLEWFEAEGVNLGRFRRCGQSVVYELLGVALELTFRRVVTLEDGLMLELELWHGDGDNRKSLLTWYLVAELAVFQMPARLREAWVGKLGEDLTQEKVSRTFAAAAADAGLFSPKKS